MDERYSSVDCWLLGSILLCSEVQCRYYLSPGHLDILCRYLLQSSKGDGQVGRDNSRLYRVQSSYLDSSLYHDFTNLSQQSSAPANKIIIRSFHDNGMI
jgi:hypothetical protein